jgi:hypothetical protein
MEPVMPQQQPGDFDLVGIVRQATARIDGVTVIDFADLGATPPEVRKAGHMLAAVNAVADFGLQLFEACDVYLARRINEQLVKNQGPDADGALDLSLGDTARRIAADADVSVWDELHLAARRDILTTAARTLAVAQRQYSPTVDDAADIGGMIGNSFAIAGNLWVSADQELTAAADDWENVPMVPDQVNGPPLATSPTNALAARKVADYDSQELLANAAILVMASRVLELNRTGGWNQFLQASLS